MNVANRSHVREGEKGFSIASVMVAAVILSILAAGISQMLINSSRHVSYLEDRLEAQDFKKEIQSLLNDEVACRNTFGQTSVPTNIREEVTIRSLKDYTGAEPFSQNEPIFPGSRIRVDKIVMTNKDVRPNNGGVGNIKLRLEISRTTTSGVQAMRPLEFLVSVEKAPAGQTIANCMAAGSGIDLNNLCVVGDQVIESGMRASLRKEDVTIESGGLGGCETVTTTSDYIYRCDGNQLHEIDKREVETTREPAAAGTNGCSNASSNNTTNNNI